MNTQDIEAREKAATPGPWRSGYKDGSDPTTVMTVAIRRKTSKVGIRVESRETKSKRFVSLTRDDTAKPLDFGEMPDTICGIADEDLSEAERVADAEFIAHAREDIPYLLAELKEAREERDVAQETVVALSSIAQERDEAREKLEAVEGMGLKESTEFWTDNMDGLLEIALETGAAAVVECIDAFYSTPEGEQRIRDCILKGGD